MRDAQARRDADGFASAGAKDSRLRITGAIADLRVQIMRSTHEAIMVGVETALVDDPALTVRLPGSTASRCASSSTPICGCPKGHASRRPRESPDPRHRGRRSAGQSGPAARKCRRDDRTRRPGLRGPCRSPTGFASALRPRDHPRVQRRGAEGRGPAHRARARRRGRAHYRRKPLGRPACPHSIWRPARRCSRERAIVSRRRSTRADRMRLWERVDGLG